MSVTPSMTIFASAEVNTDALITFVAYMAGVFALAIISHHILSKRKFVGEYYLGSRTLGIWALAFSFAATSASGGSFMGFPSLIYTHGWVLMLWIASYMVVPVVTMGLLGKRLNQVARKTAAITIPDVLRDRHQSTGLGILATSIIVFFMVFNLVAQFKAGGTILNTLLNIDYEYGLLIFAFTVVGYTAYGGFRAVVWTDVMQGVVMGIGVLMLLPLTLYVAGGLPAVSESFTSHPYPAEYPIYIAGGLTSYSTGGISSYGPVFISLAGESHLLPPGTPPSDNLTMLFLPFNMAISFFFMWAISGRDNPAPWSASWHSRIHAP